jgi:hypothetical protein
MLIGDTNGHHEKGCDAMWHRPWLRFIERLAEPLSLSFGPGILQLNRLQVLKLFFESSLPAPAPRGDITHNQWVAMLDLVSMLHADKVRMVVCERNPLNTREPA